MLSWRTTAPDTNGDDNNVRQDRPCIYSRGSEMAREYGVSDVFRQLFVNLYIPVAHIVDQLLFARPSAMPVFTLGKEPVACSKLSVVRHMTFTFENTPGITPEFLSSCPAPPPTLAGILGRDMSSHSSSEGNEGLDWACDDTRRGREV